MLQEVQAACDPSEQLFAPASVKFAMEQGAADVSAVASGCQTLNTMLLEDDAKPCRTTASVQVEAALAGAQVC